ncbi:MAG: hypothetical protein AB8D78_12645 [Akkermansiaceae bacterium]
MKIFGLKLSVKRLGRSGRGFALVSVLMLMILLGILALGMLSLSTVALRTGGQRDAMSEAKANAKMALMIALGRLQEEMGPDMRVSATAGIFDQDSATAKIEGVDQPNWLAAYESWGGWLNGSYKNPETGSTLTIQDTYGPKREQMFRRWLLSMPDGMDDDVNAPVSLSGWDDDNSVVLVGEGSLGEDFTAANPELITRAYLNSVNETGRSAWWIGPENQKARIDLAKQPRDLAIEEWESSSGDTAEVGVGAIPGFDALDADEGLSDRLVTRQTLRPAGVDADVLGQHFFDLTGESRGVIASVRTGHLKKDLSLLFEKGKDDLPDRYRFEEGDIREPSIRPMSSDIADRAILPERHFAPWNRMRHFYRMYRQDGDERAPAFGSGGTVMGADTSVAGTSGLSWDGSKPWAACNAGTWGSAWDGQDAYVRFPVLTNITYILSLKTEPDSRNAGKYDLRYVASPVYVYWNPYNVEMRVPNMAMTTRTYLAQVHPLQGRFYKNGSLDKDVILRFDDDYARMMSSSSGDIIFKPGEFRIFTPEPGNLIKGNLLDMLPGFDPQSFGGLYAQLGSYAQSENPGFKFRFSYETQWKFNFFYGNTPASFVSFRYWTPTGDYSPRAFIPFHHHVDWFDTGQTYTPITPSGQPDEFVFDNDLLPVGYFQLALKGIHDHDYDTIGWEQDWRCRNWIQAPPFYLGKGMYISEDETIANTQRIDCPYEMRFGSLLGSGKDVDDIIQHIGESAFMGNGEKVTAAALLELPTAPISSLAGFATMKIDPGWTEIETLNSEWERGSTGRGTDDRSGDSLHIAESKAWAYQSGITGPGIGNSFVHPMIPRTGVYQYLNNSVSMEMKNRMDTNINDPSAFTATDTKAYCDYWDHVLLLNDALWDDYFVSSLADQTRPGASTAASLEENLQKLVDEEVLSNSRYSPHLENESSTEVKAELEAEDGYMKVASRLMVEGMFNVNSTSIDAWYALFAGIRERQVVYRNESGALRPVEIPADKRIALSRFNTATTDQEGIDPEYGIDREDGMLAWSGVRFLDDDQLRKLAEECVKQVKRRGPFLNFSEFINRRLSDDALGVMGALQSAIDYDDENPESGSINYSFKSNSDFMLEEGDLGDHAFQTPEAAVGSRFAGIPGYVIQSDLLKPIANTLSVRDDTFRIRAYGDSLDAEGKVVARAWCEAIVQRVPEYSDSSNTPETPAREIGADGAFTDIEDSELTETNRKYGRKFTIQRFRWLNVSEV